MINIVKNKKQILEYAKRYKNFGQDFSYNEFLQLKSIGAISLIKNLSKNTVFCDKFQILVTDKKEDTKRIDSFWNYNEAKKIYDELKNKGLNVKIDNFPYTYSKIMEYEKREFEIQEQKREQNH